MIRELRLRIATRLMEKKARRYQRTIKAVNLNKAASVGIVFDAGIENNFRHIKELAKNIISTGAKVETVGYIPGNKKGYSYIGDKTYSFISDEDFNFFMQPTSDTITRFLEWKPEILLILCTSYHFPVHYLAHLSKAGLKVGKSGLYNDSLDFLIDMDETSLPALTSEIVRYLGNLHTG